MSFSRAIEQLEDQVRARLEKAEDQFARVDDSLSTIQTQSSMNATEIAEYKSEIETKLI